VFFDLLCEGDRDLRGEPFRVRHQRLQAILSNASAPLFITPSTTDRNLASDWFKRFEGAGLDGVMAKSPEGRYEANKRVMFKVKHERDCDCVVAGFRWHINAEEEAVGSLLLGLFNDAGELEHVGVCASFTLAKRREQVSFLAPYREGALRDHPWRGWAENDAPGAESARRMPGGKPAHLIARSDGYAMDLRVADRGWSARCGFQPERIRSVRGRAHTTDGHARETREQWRSRARSRIFWYMLAQRALQRSG